MALFFFQTGPWWGSNWRLGVGALMSGSGVWRPLEGPQWFLGTIPADAGALIFGCLLLQYWGPSCGEGGVIRFVYLVIVCFGGLFF